MKKIFIILFFAVFVIFKHVFPLPAKVDSLYFSYYEAVSDSDKADILLNIGSELFVSRPDSALNAFKKSLKYAERSKEVDIQARALYNISLVYFDNDNYINAAEYFNKAIIAATEASKYNIIINAYIHLGYVNQIIGNLRQALDYYSHAEDYIIIENDSAMLAQCYNLMGAAYIAAANYPKALDYTLQSLRLYENLESLQGIFRAMTSLGVIFRTQGEFEKALSTYYDALKLAEKENNKMLMSTALVNLGSCYHYIARTKTDISHRYEKLMKALSNYNESLELKREINDIVGISGLYINIGNIYEDLENFSTAEIYFNKSIQISEKAGLTHMYVKAYNSLVSLLIKSGYYSKAIKKANASLDIVKENEYLVEENFLYSQLRQAYYKIGDCDKAMEYVDLYLYTKDSIFSIDKEKIMQDLHIRYETEKKQQEIETQQLIIDKQKLESKRQNLIRNTLLTGAGIFAILFLLVFAGYRQKIRSNKLISEKNTSLEQANEEIRSQKEEIESQHIIVVKHKNYIENQKKKIDDSILYARHIQSALLTSESNLNSLVKEYFLVFLPKEVVSGDFYWAAKLNNKTIIAVADCTGHGVPGAFMSILGTSLLNEIVKRQEVSEPAEILSRLRNSIIEEMVHNSDEDMKREGMTISIVTFDNNSNKCLWAGARNPTCIFRKEKNIIENLQPDNTSIAMHLKMKEFTTHSINIDKGDVIYMYSDGITDQFGGPQGKKFSSNQFKELLKNISSKPLSEQKESIEKALDNWRNPNNGDSYEQIDDITVLGIQV